MKKPSKRSQQLRRLGRLELCLTLFLCLVTAGLGAWSYYYFGKIEVSHPIQLLDRFRLYAVLQNDIKRLEISLLREAGDGADNRQPDSGVVVGLDKVDDVLDHTAVIFFRMEDIRQRHQKMGRSIPGSHVLLFNEMEDFLFELEDYVESETPSYGGLLSYQRQLAGLAKKFKFAMDEVQQDNFVRGSEVQAQTDSLKTLTLAFLAISLFSILLLGVFLWRLFIVQGKQLDILQEVRVQRNIAVKASKAKSSFLANMSHELRTPLNAIIGFSEMLKARYFGDLTAKQEEYVDDILYSARHQLSLIEQVLDFEKANSGRLELKEEVVDLAAVAREAINMQRIETEKNRLTVDLITTGEIEPIWSDESIYRQILINLLANAIKFTPAEGSITVQLVRTGLSGLSLHVVDTGIGISQEDLERIRKPFEQAESHLSRSYGGTGLGLSIVESLAGMLGGRVEIQSAEGHGTRVSLHIDDAHFLPATQQPVVQHSAEEPADAQEAPPALPAREDLAS